MTISAVVTNIALIFITDDRLGYQAAKYTIMPDTDEVVAIVDTAAAEIEGVVTAIDADSILASTDADSLLAAID